jgi:hypothetical protein
LNYFAGRRHRRCLEKRGTFGTSRWQLHDEATLFPHSRKRARCPLLAKTDKVAEAISPACQQHSNDNDATAGRKRRVAGSPRRYCRPSHPSGLHAKTHQRASYMLCRAALPDPHEGLGKFSRGGCRSSSSHGHCCPGPPTF